MLPVVAPAAPANGQRAPALAAARAEANDQRSPSGRIVNGELRIELEALEAEWYPRGPDGPRIVTAVFAEIGHAPQVPGPLIRARAGTPVRVGVRNVLDRAIVVRGLVDRATTESAVPPGFDGLPAFAFGDSLIVPPGETRETRFIPTTAVSSFYYARTVASGSAAAADGPTTPGLAEGAFMGALVIDAAGPATPLDERILMITRWGSPAEPGMNVSWKMMLNGRSWPFTERLGYTVGDTVHWRVINVSSVAHPMHLHGFYFEVDALGDTHADSTYAAGARPLAVTQVMPAFSSMRLTWVPERAGNWLFHCHLIRHMGEVQRFEAERVRAASAAPAASHSHQMDGMAGLVTGITVRPSPGAEPDDDAPVRRIHLWTGRRADVYSGDPELGFVMQEGAEAPPPDSTHVPGSPLVLTRGEPTEIVVHNRLDIPIAVHWHGLELRSLYDGVGHWSGHPGATRSPIAPGDSIRVHITPPRAGTFMYHTHGEAGHELSQGLYGPFLVLDPGERRDADADRVFVLAARGARRDVAPAINGRTRPDPERFTPGRTYRLRFLHISPDEFKRVRLLRDGEPVEWQPLAKDGADLPDPQRVPHPAIAGIGVGETYDVAWTPNDPGVYVLEVTTDFYPATGGTVVQRVAFAVGDVAESELALSQQPAISAVELSPAERSHYAGTFVGRLPGSAGPPIEFVFSVWEEANRLYTRGIVPRGVDDAGEPSLLLPLGGHRFAPVVRELDGLIHMSDFRDQFVTSDSGLDQLLIELGGRVVLTLSRIAELDLTDDRLRRFVGAYSAPDRAAVVTVRLDNGVLSWTDPDGRPDRLIPISATRFRLANQSGVRVDFEVGGAQVGALTIVSATGKRTRYAKDN
jgi:FtsP/CotA-like multicopper oxidase with cupredoxin domain